MHVKVTSVYVSSQRKAAPNQPILTIFGTFGDLSDTIKNSKFHINLSRDFGSAGARKSHVPIIIVETSASIKLCQALPRLHDCVKAIEEP